MSIRIRSRRAVGAAAEGSLPRTVVVTGTLAADETVAVGFKLAGRATRSRSTSAAG